MYWKFGKIWRKVQFNLPLIPFSGLNSYLHIWYTYFEVYLYKKTKKFSKKIINKIFWNIYRFQLKIIMAEAQRLVMVDTGSGSNFWKFCEINSCCNFKIFGFTKFFFIIFQWNISISRYFFAGTCRTFVFKNEGHTLGNALRAVILQNPEVIFCGYTLPHPAEDQMHLRIQTVAGWNFF